MKKIKIPGVLQRAGTIDARADGEDASIEISFSSETPVERYFGKEVLGHGADEVDLTRIGSGRAPLLLDHRMTTDNQVGVIERAWVEGGRGKAVARFGKSARAVETLERVRSGELSNISVGYRIKRAKLVEEGDDGDVYRVTDWMPLEISLVPVPADDSVGVGRGADTEIEVEIEELRAMEKDEDAKKAAAAARKVDPIETQTRAEGLSDGERDALRKDEVQRVREIEARAATFNVDADTRDKAIREGWSAGQFSGHVLDNMDQETRTKAASSAASVGLSDKESAQFSFVRAIHYLANPRDSRARERAAFEIEVGEAASAKLERDAQGILIPADVLARRDFVPGGMEKRDLTVGTPTAGGNLVATDLLAGSFIDLLRNRSMVMSMGARQLSDLQGDLAIPRQTGGATAYWVAEGGAPTESQQAFDQVPLTPKTVGAFTDFTRKLMLQSSISVEALVRSDLSAVIALEVDRAALYGAGASNEPTGIVNQTGINTTTFGAADPTWAEIVDMESQVAVDNALMGSTGYLMDSAMRGALKTTEKAAGTAQFIWAGQEVNGHRAEVTNQVVDGDMFFGNWADLVVAMWSGLDLTVDPYALSTSGGIRVVALQDVDFAVRHAVSFCHSNDGV